jgi:hypothetical protein
MVAHGEDTALRTHEPIPSTYKGFIASAVLLLVAIWFVTDALIGFGSIAGATFTVNALYICAIAIVGPYQRYLRNGELARYVGVSAMTLSRWKKDPRLNTPPPMDVNGIERNDRELWDAWLKARAVSRIQRDSEPPTSSSPPHHRHHRNRASRSPVCARKKRRA